MGDEALVQRLAHRDPFALEELYRRHHDRVVRFCAAFFRRQGFPDWEAAEFIAGQCWMDLWTRPRSFSGRCRVLSWLLVIARNQCTDHARRRGAERRANRTRSERLAAQRDPRAEPPEEVAREELLEALRDAIRSLPDELREVVSLRADGRSVAEIGRRVGVPPGTVKSRLHRARGRLRRALGVFSDHGPGHAADAMISACYAGELTPVLAA